MLGGGRGRSSRVLGPSMGGPAVFLEVEGHAVAKLILAVLAVVLLGGRGRSAGALCLSMGGLVERKSSGR